MKSSKLLFSALLIGSVISISGYSAPNVGEGFSGPGTYERHPAQTAAKARAAETHPSAAKARAAETHPVAAEKAQEESRKPEENKVEKEAGKLY